MNEYIREEEQKQISYCRTGFVSQSVLSLMLLEGTLTWRSSQSFKGHLLYYKNVYTHPYMSWVSFVYQGTRNYFLHHPLQGGREDISWFPNFWPKGLSTSKLWQRLTKVNNKVVAGRSPCHSIPLITNPKSDNRLYEPLEMKRPAKISAKKDFSPVKHWGPTWLNVKVLHKHSYEARQ